ncbi:MAG: sel1 repeat family protein [Betaproteobacteria bacterium]|nr:sel1 repeat family protein [Betaproteobacteria bacterium]
MYQDGRGVAQDDAQAVVWYRKAAEQGNADAQNSLGLACARGVGVVSDNTEAADWFRQAAEQKNANAQNNFGFMLAEGLGVEQDDAEAVEWYCKAAEQGNAYAQTNLGLMYAEGRGVAQDHEQAAHWFNKAAEPGNVAPQSDFGLMRARGFGAAQNAWRDGDLLVLWRDGDFPQNFCARCGAPTVSPTRRYRLSWDVRDPFVKFGKTVFLPSLAISFFAFALWLHSREIDMVLVVVGGLALSFVLAMVLTAVVNVAAIIFFPPHFSAHIPLCAKHRWYWQIDRGVWVVFLVIWIVLIVFKYPKLDLFIVLMNLLVVFIQLLRSSQVPITVAKINEKYVWISGCNKIILAPLPEFKQKQEI